MESWAGPFSPYSAPNGGSLGALLSRGFALHSAERGQPQRSLSPDRLPVSLCAPRPHAGARAPYPAVLARPRRADTPDSKMASVGKHGEPVRACQVGSWRRSGAYRRPGWGGSCGAPAFAAGLRRDLTRRAPDPLQGSCAARPSSALRPHLRAVAGRARAAGQRASGLGNAPPRDSQPLLSSPR
ncbi:hypothetical protein D623_10026934 [Myotis brandtii]|uniref:Uncharacterized protein n=1 Tax=Myotis brandtii TaxID=109478 RepID=S7PS00_MYOBR|nr:hypothetical protein D623_10026934 [Myotis brandtii]